MRQPVEQMICFFCGAPARRQEINFDVRQYNCDAEPPRQYRISATALGKLEGLPERKRQLAVAAHAPCADGKICLIRYDPATGIISETVEKGPTP